MPNVSVQKAGKLPRGVKSAVEQLLGRAIDDNEEVSIAAVPPQQVQPLENRTAVSKRLEALLDRRAEKVRDISDEEMDSVVDEVVDHARHRRG